MSMIDGLKSLRKERANIERDRVVFSSMLEDALTADLLIESDETNLYESAVSEDDLDILIDKIPESEEEDEEIERILKSDEPMDVDDILGVDE